jgi:heparosan-N-sulfate-glucuronate 5-epimerase
MEARMRAACLGAVRQLGRSLHREIIEFRVNYPLQIVPGAEQADSLRYFIYSDRLFLDNLDLDPHGVPLKHYRLLGPHYNPLFVAWWGLHHLELAVRQRDDCHLDIFRTQLDWLSANAVTRDDGAVVWPCYFDWQEGRARLGAPWISAMYQGIVISVLVRGFRLTRSATLLKLAIAGTRVFSLDVGAGGVRSREAGRILYEEYPAFPLPRILDGFLFSLLGLYDLYVQTGDAAVGQLFTDGLEGLNYHLAWWDYRGKWSWYGSHGYLCPPHYHALNRALLTILHQLTGQRVLREVAEAWAPDNLSRRDRAEVLLMFIITKNRARIRLPNEKGS